MRVLVTGADGFVGAHLCPLLRSAGFDVLAVSRSTHGDLTGVEWEKVLQGADGLVHLANIAHRVADPGQLEAVNVLGTVRLARAAHRAGVRRFVYLSSAKVYGESSGPVPFSESSQPSPEDAYGRSKLSAELALRAEINEAGLVVLRPPLVYGPGVRANFLALLRAVYRGLPLPLASIRNQRSLVSVGNLVDAVLACLRAPQAAGRTFNVADGPAVSTPDLVRAIAVAFGKPPRLVAVSPRLLDFAGRLSGRRASINRLMSSLVLDDSAIRHALGWKPPQSFPEALGETAQWYVRAQARVSG